MALGSRGACIVLAEGLDASRIGCKAAVRGRFSMQRIKPALTEAEPMQPREYSVAPLPRGGAVNGAVAKLVRECRRHSVGQVELAPVGYITQITVRGRV